MRKYIFCLLLVMCLVSCTKKLNVDLTGIFYYSGNKAVPVFKGTAEGLMSRSVQIGSDYTPRFVVNTPGADISSYMFGTDVSNFQFGNAEQGYTKVDADVSEMPDNPGVYIITPKTELSSGLNVIILRQPAGYDTFSPELENCWPFWIGKMPEEATQ